ncbi:Peptide methionine sulfoxide reductase MsrA (EC [Olavius sp. associated proteobacterium Delta 1]|nr:Peptide methionine sulfoxide reductase MsrA (EC [Olavius sp. associated proteobacterium Delta 1]
MDGVVRTRVGYAGGKQKDPTYRSIGDHSETIQIDYDPTRVSYKELLFIFWQNHDPTSRAWSRQYMSAISYHNDEQKKLALETRAFEEKQRNKKIQTEIVPFSKFYPAEDYHQKYQLRQHSDLMGEFKAIYPRDIDFINSTAAARANGYIGGHGTTEQVKATIENLGLSSAGRQRLLAIFKRWKN